MSSRNSATSLLWVMFAFGVSLFLIGNFVTFLPGSEQYWFTFTAPWCAAGLFVGRVWLRVVAGVLAIFCVYAAFDGHRRGVEFRESLKEKAAPGQR